MKKVIISTILLLSVVTGAQFVFAADPPSGVNTDAASGVNTDATGNFGISTKLENPIQANTFNEFIALVLKIAVQILTPLIILSFIWTGFLFVRAQGNAEEIEHAKTAMFWSVIGAFILMSAWGFTQIISETVSEITGMQP